MKTRKRNYTITLFAFILLTIISCTSNNKSNKQATENTENIVLQPLQDDDKLCYENELCRISERWSSENEANIIRIEAKKQGIKNFEIKDNANGYAFFECVVDNALVISNGTGNVRAIKIYDLNTGNELFNIDDNFLGEITPDDNQTGFTYYKYSADMPMVSWDANSEEWQTENEVPAELFNQDFDNTTEEMGKNLFNGMQLAALQKVHVSIKNKKASYLNEYKWSYIE